MNRPIEFTFCLCGLYETGDDSIPHHSDTVPTLDDVVLGISFGGTRVLEWNNYSKEIKKILTLVNYIQFLNRVTCTYLKLIIFY